jgi:pimeloyl-ACP methyl ester carboxylesterase
MKKKLLLASLTSVALVVLWTLPFSEALPEQRQEVALTYGDGETLTLKVILPEGYRPSSRYPMVVALPPGPGTAAMSDAFLSNYWIEEGNRRGYILVSPVIYGPSLETAGSEVIDSVFRWLDQNVSYDAARVTLAGQSNGGIGAFHVARVAPERFGSIVVMPGGYGGTGDLSQLAGKPVLLLVGERDANWVQLANHTRDFLVLGGAEPRVEIVPGGGHVFPYSQVTLYNWIQQQYPED